MSKIKHYSQFMVCCQNAAVSWFNKQDFCDGEGCVHKVTHEDIKVVWSVKCLQNYKAIMSILCKTWDIGIDNLLFEFSYNGNRNELYMDVYQKRYNECFNVVVP